MGKLSGTGDSQRESRKTFAMETPIFIARQANSHESLEFPIESDSRESPDSRESCESIRAKHATKWARNKTCENKTCEN